MVAYTYEATNDSTRQPYLQTDTLCLVPQFSYERRQHGPMGFRGGVRMADGKAQPAFVFYLGGNEVQGKETMGRELGTMFESEISSFLVKLGKEIAARGLDFESYRTQYPDGIEKAAAEYLA